MHSDISCDVCVIKMKLIIITLLTSMKYGGHKHINYWGMLLAL